MVSLMIYCNLLEKKKNSVVYSFYDGTGERGEIEFPLYSTGPPKILKEPESQGVKIHIGKLYFKYYKYFLSGITPQNIAYEC